jgi:fluoride exporter
VPLGGGRPRGCGLWRMARARRNGGGWGMIPTGVEGLVLLVALAGAGALGAVTRVLAGAALDFLVGRDDRISRGTLVVNVVGAFFAGIVAGWLPESEAGALAFVFTVGFLGAFTTFSTWMIEAHSLLADPRTRHHGFRYLALSVGLGVAAAAIGMAIGAGLG